MVQGVHTPAGGFLPFAGRALLVPQKRRGVHPFAGSHGAERRGIVQGRGHGQIGLQRKGALVEDGRVKGAPHGHHVPDDLAQQLLLGGERHPHHGLQQERPAVDQRPLHRHRRGHKEIQGMGVHVVVLAANQGELGVRHLPAFAALAQCLRQALAHVVLIPVGQLLLLDDGLKLDAAAPGQGLHQ